VNTISLDLKLGASWQKLDMNSSFRGEVSCSLIGESIVLCRGVLVSQSHSGDVSIARLPEGMRPRCLLKFAAMCVVKSEARLARGCYPQVSLTTLAVGPDGWIHGLSVPAEAVLDMTGIRFGISRGLSLADEVRLISCDVGGARVVLLQGKLLKRSFDDTKYRDGRSSSRKVLTALPEAFQPREVLPFVVPGGRTGSFNLVTAVPAEVGGELVWSDSFWGRDEVELSGVIYFTSERATHISATSVMVTQARKQVVLSDFQKQTIANYGSIEEAWDLVFDADKNGYINFTEFAAACKFAGYRGNAFRLWSILDEDGSGEITLDELLIDPSTFM